MLSRVANSVYWMSRYVERAENIARFLGVNLNLILDFPGTSDFQWEPMIHATGDRKEFEKRYPNYSQENVIKFLVFDAEYRNSILSCLRNARENARSIREVISSEMWEQLNQFYLELNSEKESRTIIDDPNKIFLMVKMRSHLFLGLLYSTMSYQESWHFARMGMMLERADKTSRILDVKYFMLLPSVDYIGTPYDNIQWSALLKSASALEMYKKKYQRIAPKTVTEFLIFDDEFPRSIRHSVIKMEESMHYITGTPLRSTYSRPEKELGRLRSDLDYGDIDEVISFGVHEFLDKIQQKMNRLDEAINATFFQLKPTKTNEDTSQQ